MVEQINTTRQCKAEALEVLTNSTPRPEAETSRILASVIAHDHQQRQLVLILYLHFCWEIKSILTQNTECTQDNYHDYPSVAIKHELLNSFCSLEHTPKSCKWLVKDWLRCCGGGIGKRVVCVTAVRSLKAKRERQIEKKWVCLYTRCSHTSTQINGKHLDSCPFLLAWEEPLSLFPYSSPALFSSPDCMFVYRQLEAIWASEVTVGGLMCSTQGFTVFSVDGLTPSVSR